MAHTHHAHHQHRKKHRRHMVASGSLITIGSGLLSFSLLSLTGFGL